MAFSRDKSEVAATIADGSHIRLYRGPDLLSLKRVGNDKMALAPTFSPNGLLAYAGEGKWGQRIYVDGKSVSPAGLHATAPTFCRHPDGIRLVFAVGVGDRMDLVSTAETGGNARRLTAGRGQNSYPACSPDGRLVAFFSTRKSGAGPGLYIMRLDGTRPKRVSTLVGDSLRWSRLP